MPRLAISHMKYMCWRELRDAAIKYRQMATNHTISILLRDELERRSNAYYFVNTLCAFVQLRNFASTLRTNSCELMWTHVLQAFVGDLSFCRWNGTSRLYRFYGDKKRASAIITWNEHAHRPNEQTKNKNFNFRMQIETQNDQQPVELSTETQPKVIESKTEALLNGSNRTTKNTLSQK